MPKQISKTIHWHPMIPKQISKTIHWHPIMPKQISKTIHLKKILIFPEKLILESSFFVENALY